MRTLDFTALTQPVSKQDVDLLKTIQPVRTAGPWPRRELAIFVAVVAAMMIFFMVFTSILLGSNDFTFGPFLMLTFFVGIIIAIYAAISAARRRYLAKLYKFAQANDITLRYDVGSPAYSGMIFDEGHSRQIKEALAFSDGVELGNYEYVTGSGKSRTTHLYGYARVALNRSLPNMVLDAKSNNFLNLSSLPDTFDRSQRLKLEGDFNNYFDLYVPKQYERDALYVFTPDVMQALVDRGKQYDMEVVDSELFVYFPLRIKLDSQAVLTDMLAMLDTIGTELRDQTRRYSDEKLASNVPAGTAVAQEGKRLKKSLSPLIIVIVIFIVLHFAFSFAGPSGLLQLFR